MPVQLGKSQSITLRRDGVSFAPSNMTFFPQPCRAQPGLWSHQTKRQKLCGHPSPSGPPPRAPSLPAWAPTRVRPPLGGCSLGRPLGLPVNAREGTPVLNRGSDGFCSQGLYGLGRRETLIFQSLTGLGKRRAVQINAMYNKSENCQNWVFTFTVKLKLDFFSLLKNSLAFFFFSI